ncbi:MAG TPA: Hsp20/alpha crystallin family protein [Candidatus Limnocylindria bacterium]|nr:Hsp20/alpha crystallin family protein [Candidatus Limnocylindria bacterium]
MTLWNDLLSLQNELQRLLQAPGSFFREPSSAGVFPPLNVFRAPDGGLIIRAEIPGVERHDVTVTIEGRRLTITGERKAADLNGSYHRRERPHGKFARTVTLPEDIDSARTNASLRNGVLTLTIPQHEAVKPRRIEVTS